MRHATAALTPLMMMACASPPASSDAATASQGNNSRPQDDDAGDQGKTIRPFPGEVVPREVDPPPPPPPDHVEPAAKPGS